MRLTAAIWKYGSAVGFLLAIAAPVFAAPDMNWTTYENQRFGYRLDYPADIFPNEEGAENDNGKTFISEDGRAKIVVFGAENDQNLSPKEYRRVLVNNFGGYEQLDYQPAGRSWFVLSGFRGENIYYQKVMFSCGNKIINVFSMTYPTAEKRFYDDMIERMENEFRPGPSERC